MRNGVGYCSPVNSAGCAESVISLYRVPLVHVGLVVHDFGPNKPLLHICLLGPKSCTLRPI